MKLADIHPDGAYAVRIPIDPRRPRDGSVITSAVAGRLRDGRKRVFHAQAVYASPTRRVPERTVMLSPQSVLAPWAAYELERDWDEALRMDSQRDDRLAYEAEKAERHAAIQALLPAFEGLRVQPSGYANFDRPDIDLADELREQFIDTASTTATVRWDVFAAIAERILSLQQALLDTQSGWTGGGRDTGLAEVIQLPPRRSPEDDAA